MDGKNSKIVDWYKGRNIFITGGTGFMGKVLVEKLLYTCNSLGNLYILMRNKREKTPKQRIEDMWKLPLFSRLRETYPDAKKKIIPLNGDLYSENLGLNESDMRILVEDVSVVFHCAATLKLEAKLADAIEQNTAGTEKVINIVKTIKHLDLFMHVSTAFCSADIDVFEEKIYPTSDDPREVIKLTKWMNNDALNAATKDMIKPHPNTYTYSKRLAESLVAEEAGKMNVVVVRPSIVTPACKEPLPGWVDSLNGPMGLTVASGKGVLRSMHCQGHYRAQTVPVDIAINAMIVIAYEVGSKTTRPKEVPVYNFTNDGIVQVSWKDVLDNGRNSCKKYPFEQMIWYPDGDIRSSYIVHQLYSIFLHWLPAYLIDFLMLIFRQKRFMVRVQTKIRDGLELLHFFANREWHFSNKNFSAMIQNLDPIDAELFPMDFNIVPVAEYIDYCVLGARQYCMKENPKSLPRCRIQFKILYVLDRLLAAAFYFGIAYMLYNNIGSIKSSVDYLGACIKFLPVIGNWISVEV